MANSIFDSEYDSVLPGVLTEISSQYEAGYDTSLFGTTDSICVVGTAFDGPVGYPTPVYSVEHAKYLYGSSYDTETHRESSLMIGIQNAWNHGARTIYGVRINGIDMQKAFNFREESDFQLRLQSRYPSNIAKQCYFVYDDTTGAEKITLYKPPTRATIAEKMAGNVESAEKMMKIEIDLAADYGYTKNDKLVNIISLFNNHKYNNVLELDIIDSDGKAVTRTDEAYDMTLGALHGGIYFLGRGKSVCDKVTKIKTDLVIDEDDTVPYSDFSGNYFRTIEVNTDVSQPLPIAFNSVNKEYFLEVCGVSEQDDILDEVGASKLVFAEDKVDYEESKLSAWEIYKKLGRGFATTAHLEKRLDKNGNELTPKVVETDLEDTHRIVAIEDGIYSILEDADIRFRVMGNDICADTVITGKIPKASEFKQTTALYGTLLSNNILLKSKVDSEDETSAKTYEFHVYAHDEIPEIDEEEIFTEKIAKTVGYTTDADSLADIVAEEGEIAIVFDSDDTAATASAVYVANAKGKFKAVEADQKFAGLYMAGKHIVEIAVENDAFSFKTITQMTDLTSDTNAKYFMVDTNNDLFIMEFGDITSAAVLVSTVNTAVDEDKDTQLSVFYESSTAGTNYVCINFPYFDTLTLTDFVEMLNDSVLEKVFDFYIASESAGKKYEYVTDIDTDNSMEPGNGIMMNADRRRGYNYSLYIPFTTSDSFVRQLAQSCCYTELKTAACHGIIGCNRISDTSKTALANKVSELKDFFSGKLYVKNNFGRNMLDANNLPYPIGRCVSCTCFQEAESNDGYDTIMNGAAGYAGLVSSLDIAVSSTAKEMDIEPMFEFSHSQLQTLSALGIVTIRNTYTKGYVITDGVTLADNNDLLRRLFNSRISYFVEQVIRAAAEPFIGCANSSANRNSLQTAINSKLSSLKDVLLRGYSFEIVDDGTADQYTYIDINYVIVPYNEIREIRNFITIRN